MVQKTDQGTLVTMLPQLYNDLKDNKTDTLKDYHMEWTHVNMQSLSPMSDLDHFLLKEMPKDAAVGVHLQCHRKYWNVTSGTEYRATELHKLSAAERKGLPSHNIAAEVYLGKFGYLASLSAERSNRFFKGKRIRDDLTSLCVIVENVDNSTLKIMKCLDEMEITWTSSKKERKKEYLLQNVLKKQRNNDLIDQLLIKCKEHKGPVTSFEELNSLVKSKPNKLKQILSQEVHYQKLTHLQDFAARKSLYKINSIDEKDLIENLTIILGTEATSEPVIFPTEEEIMEILDPKKSPPKELDKNSQQNQSMTLAFNNQ